VLCQTETVAADYPLAACFIAGVPVYDGERLRALLDDPAAERAIKIEWSRCLASGPGGIAIRNAFPDIAVVDEMTEVLNAIIEEEVRAGRTTADHYAKAGANTRAWNVSQKAAIVAPDVFVRYYSNELFALAAQAWLGPWYQITAQVNIVHPGGEAQFPHRDYHVGFMTNDDAHQFPAHAHLLSQVLTLQSVVAHTDMPAIAGSTMILPYSQRFSAGYVAWRDPRFAEYFMQHAVQLDLRKGDALFLNPGLHHAGGANRTSDFHRFANLMQISSAMGIAMESVDRYVMARAIFPSLVAGRSAQSLSGREIEAAIAASADGYPFPTNIDTNPPVQGLATESVQHMTLRALDERWSADRYNDELDAHRARRRP
jgi:ectoine hydroxylase-related dioxygenase (phytanoyl-CoA dioxygenase family)